MSRVLSVSGLRAGYGQLEVLHGIDLHVDSGEIVTILGANGAGKTTLLLALAGAIPARGDIELFGSRAVGALYRRTRQGLSFLPDERGVVRALTVQQNLRLARVSATEAYSISRELEALRGRRAGDLSGGEQQILALTMAIARRPRLLLVDEMSFGLAPVIVERMFGLLRVAADAGATILLVEQFARRALEAADRAYVLQRGEVVLEGRAEELRGDLALVESSYLGGS